MTVSSENNEILEQDSEQSWTSERLHQASYKDLGTPAEVEARFYRHLLSSDTCQAALKFLLTESSTTTRDYSITIDSFDLLNEDPILGHLLLRYPATLLPLLENAVVQAQTEILRQLHERGDDYTVGMTVKGGKGDSGIGATRVHARLIHLPPSCFKNSLNNVTAADVGKIVQVTGCVIRTSPIQMYESARTYKCTSKKGCGRTFTVHADMEQRNNALHAPDRCILSLPSGERCQGNKLQVVEGGSVHTDYQEIKIQEAASRTGIGNIPRSLLIKLQHDLVDTCQPGDEVVVVGSLLAQWQQNSVLPDVECQVGMAMSAHSVRVVAEKGSSAWKNPSQNSVGEMDKFRKEFDEYWGREESKQTPIAARDFICRAVCPKLYGLKVVKLALLITLIGGVSSDAYEDQRVQDATSRHADIVDGEDEPDQFCFHQGNDDGLSQSAAYYGDASRSNKASNAPQDKAVKTRRRDQSHLLLVGDPGTGKSQVLRFAAALCPRSVMTTGVGTTSAGLTCAAVREGNGKEFALEAGALVLADKGVCCIDEFGCIQDQDRTTIHEAMEQQTLSVAKAGIVCKLNCRATIIAVMNPRDCLYDNQASLSVNTGLGTPLLSRFDLIFKLVDASDAERDSNVTTYLLRRAVVGEGLDVARTDNGEGNSEPWTIEKLRAYISIVKERFQPVMSDEAALLLERHYEKCRSAQSNTIPVTVRFLESLIRLSQAHARLMYHNVVSLEDAVAVLRVSECSAFAYGGFDHGSVDDFENILYQDPMTVDFSDDPDLEFLCFQYRILKRYDMLDYIDDNRKQNAIMALGETSAGVGTWQQMENPRERFQTDVAVGTNAAATGGWAFHAETTKENDSALFDWESIKRSAGGDDITHDHYGRLHLSQNPQNKRPKL